MLRLYLLTRTRTEIRFGHVCSLQAVVMPVSEWEALGSPNTILVEN